MNSNHSNAMNLANRITIIRILLIPLFIAAITYYSPERQSLRSIALIIFSLAVFTDAIDGYIARIKSQKTRLGTFLDPLADKLLLVSAFVSLALLNNIPAHLRLPPWVPIIVISRDIIIVLGTIIVYLISGNIEIVPTKLGKVTTFLQMITIISVLLYFKFSFIIWTAAAFFSVASGLDYIMRGSRLLNGANIASSR